MDMIRLTQLAKEWIDYIDISNGGNLNGRFGKTLAFCTFTSTSTLWYTGLWL